MTMNEAKTGWGDLLSGKNAIYALALAGGVTLHAVNIYIATTILPSVVGDIGGLDYYAWSTTLFVAASILGSALSARLLRGAGPRGAYGIAALLFATGTLVCAVAPTMPVLLAGRFVQGFGGGFLYALAYSVIRIVLPGYLAALISMGWTIGSLLTSGRTGAAGARAIGAGPAVSFTGLAMLAVLLPIEGAGNWLVLTPSCIGLLLVGIGIGMAWPHLVTSIFQQAPASEQAVAAAAITTVQLFAAAMGAAAAGMVANLAGLTEPGGIAGTSNAAAWLFATFALAPAVCLVIAQRVVSHGKRAAQ
jgi:hypothetical protein